MEMLPKSMTVEKASATAFTAFPFLASGAVSLANHYNYELQPWVWTLYTWGFFISLSIAFCLGLHLTWVHASDRGWNRPQKSGVVALIAVITAIIVVAIAGWGLVKKPPPPPPVQADSTPALKPLVYQICGGFGIEPGTNKTHDFQLEIDIFNPNDQELTLRFKHWYVQLDGFPGQAIGSDTMRLAANGTTISGVTRQPVIGARVWFKPFKRLVGHVSGSYHYELSFGSDEDSATTPIEINGEIGVDFGPDGLPIGNTPGDAVKFTPTTGKNMNFDPTPCEVDPSVRV